MRKDVTEVSKVKRYSKAILLTVCGGLQGFETSRLQYFLENGLTNGGEFVSIRRRPHFISRNISVTNLS